MRSWLFALVRASIFHCMCSGRIFGGFARQAKSGCEIRLCCALPLPLPSSPPAGALLTEVLGMALVAIGSVGAPMLLDVVSGRPRERNAPIATHPKRTAKGTERMHQIKPSFLRMLFASWVKKKDKDGPKKKPPHKKKTGQRIIVSFFVNVTRTTVACPLRCLALFF